MSKKVRPLLALTLSIVFCFNLGSSASSKEDSAEKLLNDVIRAHGGQKALSCTSIILDIDGILVQKGLKCDTRILAKSNMFRLQYKLAENHMYRFGYDGNQAWIIDKPSAKQPTKLDLVQVSIFKLYALVFTTRWLQYLRTQGINLKQTEQEQYRGVTTDVLQANVDIIGNVDFLIEANSHLLRAVRFNFPGDWQPTYEIIYDSYTDQQGIKVPGRISIFRNKEGYRDYKVRQAQLCPDIADSVFLPDL